MPRKHVRALASASLLSFLLGSAACATGNGGDTTGVPDPDTGGEVTPTDSGGDDTTPSGDASDATDGTVTDGTSHGVSDTSDAGDAKGDPASVWVIGDTMLDIKAARANGARALGVATGSTPVETLRDAGADLTLADLSNAEAVLAALLG